MDTPMDQNMAKAEASFKNEDELEITYLETVKTAKEKKRIRETIMREHPEVLLSDYMGPDDNMVLCNLLFFTSNLTAWYTTLCSAWTCVKKGGIGRGRQIILEGEKNIKLTVNLYHNGTVMVQGTEANLTYFQRKFKDLKSDTLKYRQDLEVKATAMSSGAVTDPSSPHGHSLIACTSCDTVPKTPSSPDKRLRVTMAQFEQDFITFKEETKYSLQRLQDRILHPDMNLVRQLCVTVRQLEEANQELRQEVRSLKEELLRNERHCQGPMDQIRDSRSSEPSDKESILSDSATNAVEVPTPALPPQDQHHHNYHHSSPAFRRDMADANHGHQGTGLRPSSKDNIFILCDSNGNHLEHRRLFPRRHVRKLWCPTTHAAKDILQKGLLNPSHIIIHTGTNDLKKKGVDVAEALIATIRLATEKHPEAKVILSSLLPRHDIPTRVTEQINSTVMSFCANIPNVKVAHHTNITINHLYDNVHIHKDGMRLFAKNLKDATLNRERIFSPVRGNFIGHEHQEHRPSYAAVVSNRDSTDLTQIRAMLQHLCDNLLK